MVSAVLAARYALPVPPTSLHRLFASIVLGGAALGCAAAHGLAGDSGADAGVDGGIDAGRDAGIDAPSSCGCGVCVPGEPGCDESGCAPCIF